MISYPIISKPHFDVNLVFELVQVHVVANRQCLMKFLAPVDPSIEYTTNKCFRLTATRSRWALKGLFQENRIV
jgi:hypothetical protein